MSDTASSIVRRLGRREAAAFKVAADATRKVLQRRTRTLRLVRDGYAKLARHEEPLAQLRDDLTTLLRLVRAWAQRQYIEVPWKTLLYAAAAIVYFLNPVDVIPDFLPVIGFVDDAAVVAAVVKSLHDDLEAFRAWENARPETLEEAEFEEVEG